MPLWTIILIGYGADLILGDPAWFPHPVRIIGWFINKLEPPIRQRFKDERISGAIFALIIISASWLLVYLIIVGLTAIDKRLGLLSAVYFVYTSLATKDLGVQAMRVYHALESGNINLARENLGMIVGRDTDNLNESEIVRATVETVSENMVDGILSPLFYAFLGGAPLAIAYKAVNTLDSMVGYKNEKYINFGLVSARTDDVVNYIPARISALLIPIAAKIEGKEWRNSLKIAIRDRKNHTSPNSAIPEAAVAGALNIQLGGTVYYRGTPTHYQTIGGNDRALTIEDIRETIRISYITSFLFLTIGIVTALII